MLESLSVDGIIIENTCFVICKDEVRAGELAGTAGTGFLASSRNNNWIL